MGTDFVLQIKCTIFWLNRGLREYLDLYAPDFPKSTSKYFLHPSTFSLKHPFLEVFLIKTTQIMLKTSQEFQKAALRVVGCQGVEV